MNSYKKIALQAFFVALFGVTIFARAEVGGVDESRRRVVDFKADIMRPIKIGDSSALNLLGNVVFFHNGTIIMCDSAIRYNDRRMECFDNVIVNKDSTYIYGDKADYNGEHNIVSIYSPIIKLVNNDAILYTYNFSFNTLTNIGVYSGGATMRQDSNLLESQRGYFYANQDLFIGIDDVEMKDPDYILQSDSVQYAMDTDIATFYTQTYIWNGDQILSAKQGSYNQPQMLYRFTSDSYILTEDQEVWSDTLVYYSKNENMRMYQNIQMSDKDKSSTIFGDFAEYWGDKGNALVTKRPSLISIDVEVADTLYMRADSMFLYTFSTDSVFVGEESELFSGETAYKEDSIPESLPALDSLSVVEEREESVVQEVKELKVLNWFQKIMKKFSDRSDERKKVRDAKREIKAEERRLKAQRKLEMKSFSADSLIVDSDSTILAGLVDSLAVDSLVLETEESDSIQRVIRAYRDVKIYRTDFQIVCDSLVGFSIDSTAHLYIDPIMWNTTNQIASEVIDIYTKNGKLDKAVFTGEPIMSSKVAADYFNQIKGKTIEAIMENNTIRRTEVIGNGQTYYYMQDDSDKSFMGFMVAECANITFVMDSSAIDKIIYRGSPVYTIYPMDKIPLTQEVLLPGFKWEEHRRPTKADVFDRAIRQSQREEYEAKEVPQFKITERIQEDISSKIESGVWRDRTEKIPQAIIDYSKKL